MRPTLRDLFAARLRIGGIAYRTPLERSDWLSELAGCDVYLKLECWQRTRSFKIRGAYNAIASLPAELRGRGLVAASAGNHGQAVALVAREFGVPAVIFVPATAPETKQAHIRGHGAELRLVEGTYDDAEVAAAAFAKERSAVFVHPFVDPAVVAGQGTIGLEILETLPDVSEVLVPVGGGGLIAGIGIALRGAAGDGVRIVGVNAERSPSMHAAFEAGRVVDAPIGPTLADGLAGGVEPTSYERAREVADAVVLTSEAAIESAVRELFRHEGVVAEGAGATPVAALLEGRWRPTAGPAVLVVSGGNIDASRLEHLLGAG